MIVVVVFQPNQRADPIEELKKRVQGLESQLSEGIKKFHQLLLCDFRS